MKTKMLLAVPVIAAMSSISAQAAVEVDEFDGSLFNENGVEKLRKQDPFLACAVKILQDSYRAHLDKLRAKENPSDLLRDDNYGYFLTINRVLIDEIAKMAFGISIKGDSVHYVNDSKDKILECISGGAIFTIIQKYRRVY